MNRRAEAGRSAPRSACCPGPWRSGPPPCAAGLVGTGTSPVLAVGAAAVDASPEGLKRFAIDTFGTDDKTALLLGIGIVLAIGAVVLGIVSLRRPRAG